MNNLILLPPCLRCVLPGLPKLTTSSDIMEGITEYIKKENLLKDGGIIILNPSLKRMLMLGINVDHVVSIHTRDFYRMLGRLVGDENHL